LAGGVVVVAATAAAAEMLARTWLPALFAY